MTERRGTIWADLSRTGEVSPELLLELSNNRVDYIVGRSEQLAAWPPLPDRVTRVCEVHNGDLSEGAAELGDVLLVTDLEQVARARELGCEAALRARIEDGDSMRACQQLAGEVDYLLIAFSAATNIPLELLIAESEKRGTRIVKEVDDAEDAWVTLGVLERGPQGVALADPGDLRRLAEHLDRKQQRELTVTAGRVTAVRSVGMGYRACVDTVSLMEPDEGMVVGSTSGGGIVVCAEVHYLPYMNLRPFRVNAGAVHSYVWGDGVAEYLTDLGPGSTVLVTDTEGTARPVVVGRVKTEVRPLRLLEVEAEGHDAAINVFLQDDWHVRVFDAAGKPRNLTEVRVGDELLTHTARPGRHVGIPVTESIVER